MRVPSIRTTRKSPWRWLSKRGDFKRVPLVQHLGTGRRKTAVARVFLRSGKGTITVNGRTFENYFPSEASRAIVRQPLLATETADKFDILITTDGGGMTGQAGAAKLGIARALLEFNIELRAKLKGLGLLTRDPRQHERKKYGQKGARKRFQFSKR
jgi:small subunit ribosomal protein S9